jgi:hypothetical protein
LDSILEIKLSSIFSAGLISCWLTRVVFFVKLHFLDDDDNLSQITTGSQESQDDLIELGLANEDLKPKVCQRLMQNVSNPQV